MDSGDFLRIYELFDTIRNEQRESDAFEQPEKMMMLLEMFKSLNTNNGNHPINLKAFLHNFRPYCSPCQQRQIDLMLKFNELTELFSNFRRTAEHSEQDGKKLEKRNDACHEAILLAECSKANSVYA